MNDRYAALMVTVLHKEYPEIASIISEKIKESLPAQSLTDLHHIEHIVSSFKKEKGVTEHNWTRGKSNIDISESREMLTAIVLLFYHPEKLLQMTNEYTRSGVLRELSSKIGTTATVLSHVAAKAAITFKAYADFRREVYRLYELIKIENKFFK